MSAGRSRTYRDDRRRKLGQNFLVDPAEIRRLLAAAQIQPGELIVEVGAGRGQLTEPMAREGGRVIAIEPDPSWAAALRSKANRLECRGEIEVAEADFREVKLPNEPFRVISNPPFGLTTALFSHLLERPSEGPWRADLLVQHEVARKRAAAPPTTLRSAAWAPWWEFELGPVIPPGRSDRSHASTLPSSRSAADSRPTSPSGWRPASGSCCVPVGSRHRSDPGCNSVSDPPHWDSCT